jgi:hypothetical protein
MTVTFIDEVQLQFNAIAADCGGVDRLTGAQRDYVAKAARWMVSARYAPPLEAKRMDDTALGYLAMLPCAQKPSRPAETITEGMSAAEAAAIYARAIADADYAAGDDGFETVVTPEPDIVVRPGNHNAGSLVPFAPGKAAHAPAPAQPPTYPRQPERAQSLPPPQPATAFNGTAGDGAAAEPPKAYDPDFRPFWRHPDDIVASNRPRSGTSWMAAIDDALLSRARERPGANDPNSTGHHSMSTLLQSRPPSGGSPGLTLPTSRPGRWGGRSV